MDVTMDHSAKLPVEIFLKITSYLEGDEIFPCLGVCRRWRALLNFNELWKNLCQKARIFDPITAPTGPSPLCSWAEAYFRYRCIPMSKWRRGKFKCLTLEREEPDHYCEAWDGHYVAIYYYHLGKIYLYAIYEEINVIQVIKVPLPQKEVYYNASIAFTVPYIIVSRYNVAIIYKKNHRTYTILKYISVRDTFDFGLDLSKKNSKIQTEIAWGHVWIKAESVQDTFITNLQSFSKKFISGKPYLAFNDNVKLVIAWKKSLVRVTTINGDILLNLNKDNIKSVDYNSKILVLNVVNQVEIIDIRTGNTLSIIQTKEKVDMALGNSLILLEGDRISTLSSYSLGNGALTWKHTGLQGRARSISFVGSQYLFIVPSFCRDCYCVVDWNGKYIREGSLPYLYDQFPGPSFSEILPFIVVNNLCAFDIISFV